MAFPLQDTECHQAAAHMVPLRPLRAGLTAAQAELVLADPDHFLNLSAEAIHLAYLCCRQGEAIGGTILGAVSDDQNFQAPSKPAGFRPVGMAPIGT
jgi:hypothetical protein